MFNDDHYAQQKRDMRPVVEAGDQAWRKDIGKRWGQFQMMLVERTEETLAGHRQNEAMATDQGRAYIQDQEARLSEKRHMAKGYLSGEVQLRDPVDAEVTLRLYAQASAG